MASQLDRLFNPKTIAVIGASERQDSVGYAIFHNLGSYKGKVYPINPKRDSINGVKAYPQVSNCPEKIDLGIIATPAATIPQIVEDCGKSGVAGLVIISAGFTEAGKDGQLLADQVLEIARKYSIRIIGPNCLGFLKPSISLNASFSTKIMPAGRVAFISQSGALGTAIIDWAVQRNIGFSYFVSVGSMIDIGFPDLIDYFGSDPDTTTILIYMETMKDARRFLSAARAFTRTKPIIVLKVGKSAEGAKAALSHTGSLAGNDAVFDAAFRRAGIIRVKTVEDLFDCAQTLALQKRPLGKRLAIVTNAGGPGVIATDYLIEKGGELAKISPETIEKLNSFLPPTWSKGNPVDVLGDADHERYRKALELVIAEKGNDGILMILTPQAMTDAPAIAREIISLPNPEKKTLLASFIGGDDVKLAVDMLEKGGIPTFVIPEHAVRCFMFMYSYSRNLELLYETPATIPHAFKPDTEKNRALIQKIVSENRFVLTEMESKQLVANYGIPVTKHAVARSPADAAKIAAKIGFPVVMKILSQDIIHKTNVGGVKVGIKSAAEAKSAFTQIISSAKKAMPKARIEGVFVEKMVSKKYELLIGAKKDPLFGPVIVFGMGGVAVEVFKDTSIGLPPLNMALAMRLISETTIYNLLKGYRGMPGVDLKSIQFLLYKFAYLVMDFPEIKEIDINPFAVDESGGIVLDAKVVLDEAVIGKPVKPYSHMVISPYPKEYIIKWKTKKGKPVIIRPIKPEDEELCREMFSSFSEATQRLRFFTVIKDISHDLLVRFTQIDYDREISLVAEVEEKRKKKIIGLVRLVQNLSDSSAEFSLVVSDSLQGQGLGSKFTDYILEIAKGRNIKRVYADFSFDNAPISSIFKKRGFRLTPNHEKVHAELDL
ncbi:MAG: bifunctional acetate--CoA ligase family protein/GNAT family N-acetyltransferase [Candidatus Woesearchaeota archaeon]